MKKYLSTLSVLIILIITSCNSGKKSNEVASYSYNEEKVEMSDELRKITPDWVVEGKTCYGLVMLIDKNKIASKGEPIKAKIVKIGKDAITMKALESISLVKSEACTKMAISKGETWQEKEGDLYLTKEEAITALKNARIYIEGDKATVN